ncbi:hypothetical protein J6590_016888 [Homalodisca vitripennis]|nr:hypothetical protein J6590_016888 [Homalodisca vitripennis]
MGQFYVPQIIVSNKWFILSRFHLIRERCSRQERAARREEQSGATHRGLLSALIGIAPLPNTTTFMGESDCVYPVHRYHYYVINLVKDTSCCTELREKTKSAE